MVFPEALEQPKSISLSERSGASVELVSGQEGGGCHLCRARWHCHQTVNWFPWARCHARPPPPASARGGSSQQPHQGLLWFFPMPQGHVFITALHKALQSLRKKNKLQASLKPASHMLCFLTGSFQEQHDYLSFLRLYRVWSKKQFCHTGTVMKSFSWQRTFSSIIRLFVQLTCV